MVWKTKKRRLWQCLNGESWTGFTVISNRDIWNRVAEKEKRKTQTLRNDTFLLHSSKLPFYPLRVKKERDKAKETIYIPFVVPQITRRSLKREGDYRVPLFSPVSSTLIPQKIRSFLASFPETILGLRPWLRWIKGFSSKTHFGFDRG